MKLATYPGDQIVCDGCGLVGNQVIPVIVQGVDPNDGQRKTAIELRCIHCPPDCYHVRLAAESAVFPPASSWPC